MNEVEKTLYRTRKTLLEVCEELGIKPDPGLIKHIEECSSCGIWCKTNQLTLDLDKNPICKDCKYFYGM